jgi:hypothetical protein
MLTLEYAKDPVYGNADGTGIQLIVKWKEFNEEHPFMAATYDPHQHGRDLYIRAKAGEFGEVLPHVLSAVATQPQPTTTGSQDL